MTKLTCQRCGHKWVPRVNKPLRCPSRHCKSYLWKLKKGEKQ